jgi:hypothetical protein
MESVTDRARFRVHTSALQVIGCEYEYLCTSTSTLYIYVYKSIFMSMSMSHTLRLTSSSRPFHLRADMIIVHV